MLLGRTTDEQEPDLSNDNHLGMNLFRFLCCYSSLLLVYMQNTDDDDETYSQIVNRIGHFQSRTKYIIEKCKGKDTQGYWGGWLEREGDRDRVRGEQHHLTSSWRRRWHLLRFVLEQLWRVFSLCVAVLWIYSAHNPRKWIFHYTLCHPNPITRPPTRFCIWPSDLSIYVSLSTDNNSDPIDIVYY